MSGAFYVAAGLAAAVTSTAQLLADHGRLPYGNNSLRAIGWWLLILALDGLVAVGATRGIVPIADMGTVNASGAARAVLVGVLAPLALRSPIRKASVAGSPEPVGVTYVYDVVRIRLEWALDERMTRLRRVDSKTAIKALADKGWTGRTLGPEIIRHVKSRRKMEPDSVSAIIQSVYSSQTLPTEPEQLEGLVSTCLLYTSDAADE